MPPEFTAPVQVSATTFGDLRVASDAAGVVHVIATTEKAGRGLVHLTNASGAWTEEEITSPPARGSDNSIALASDTDRTIWVAFARYSRWNPCFFECSPPYSRLDGYFVINNASGTWSEPVRLPDGIDASYDIAVRDGELHVAYSIRGAETQIGYLTNVGGTWARETVSPGYWPDIELGAAGDPRIVFRSYSSSFIPESKHASRSFGTWNSQLIPDSSGDGTPPLLAVNSADASVVSYAVYRGARGYPNWVTTLDKTGWSTRREVGPEGADEMALGPGDALHMIYARFETRRDDGLWWGWLGAGTVVNRLLDDSARDALDAPSAPQSMALDPSGLPHVVYVTLYDDGREGLWYMSGIAPPAP